MRDEDKSRDELLEELKALRAQVAATAPDVRDWRIGELEERVRQRTTDLEHVVSGAHCLLWYAYVEDRGSYFAWEDYVINEAKAMEIAPVERAPGQSYGSALKKLRHPDDSERMDRTADEALKTGQEFYAQDYRCRGADGGWMHLHEEVHIERLEPGRWRVVGVCTDISERVRMEEEIRKNRNLESLGVLAGGIAHDFNNMLTGVIGGLSLLEMSLAEGSRERDIARDALEAADRTRALTQQLLTFARGGVPRKEEVVLPALIRETVELALRGGRTQAAFRLDEGLPPLHIDRGQIGQVIHNLAINADQAMPEGGPLVVKAEQASVAGGDDPMLEAGDYVKVSVADRGTGMPPEVLARIFDPYYSTRDMGQGLGLSIAHSVVQRHGGRFAVDSEEGVGSTFAFYLPVVREEEGGKEGG